MQTSWTPYGERLPELLSELSLWKFHKNVPLLKPSSNYFFLWFISRGREKKKRKENINCVLRFWSSSDSNEATRTAGAGFLWMEDRQENLWGRPHRCRVKSRGRVRQRWWQMCPWLTSVLGKPKSLQDVDITFASLTGAIIVN